MSFIFNGSAAKLGRINVQPIAVAIAKPQTFTSLTLSAAKSSIELKSSHLDGLITALKGKDSIFVDHNLFAVLPAFKTVFRVAKPLDTRLLGKELGPDIKFSPYEELTGISKVRPEILLVTNFQPIFDGSRRTNSEQRQQRKDSNTTGLNPVGEFLDAQIQLQHLRHASMVKLINDMKKDSEVKQILDEKEEEFTSHIDSLTSHVDGLYEIVSDIDRLKNQLGFKDTSSTSYERLASRYFGSLVQTGTPMFDVNSLNDVSFSKVLSNVGFDPKKVSSFTGTKKFLQTIYDLENLLHGESFNILGISTIDQRNDKSAVHIHKHKPMGFSFDPTLIDSPSLTDINSANQDNIIAVANGIKRTFDNLFASSHFSSNESRLAFLCNFLSREYTMSKGLGDANTRKFINDTYSYKISDENDNEEVVDVILGLVGEKITDRTDVFSQNSLTNVAQKVVDDVSILLFEPDYIDFEQSIYTPGSAYLLDTALEITNTGFNLTNLQTFSSDIGGHLGRFTSMASQLGLLPMEKSHLAPGKVDSPGEILKHGRALFDNILASFFDVSTMLPRDDISAYDVTSIFTSASNDNYLKSLLFLYVYMKTWMSNTHGEKAPTAEQKAVDLRLIGQPPPPALPVVFETLIKEIDRRINGEAKASSRSSIFATVTKSVRFGVSHVAARSVIDELRDIGNTNKFLNTFFARFGQVYNAFVSTNAIVNSHSRFSATPSVALMMIIFETILSTVTTFLPKTILGQFNTKSSSSVGSVFYAVSSASSILSNSQKNRLSVNTIQTKLNNEINAVVNLVFGIVSSLSQLKDAIDATTKSLKSEEKVKKLNEIIQVVGSAKLLSLALTPQQIFLMKSSLDDILDKLQQGTTESPEGGKTDFDEHNGQRDDVALLDDSLISANLKKMLMAFLSSDRFSDAHGQNARLLTVGIPSGFTQKLRERVKLEKIDAETLNSKQLDVVRVNVYKVDVEHQDLIFKPQSFLFELSRFVPRTSLNILEVSEHASMEQITDALPTRDYSLNTSMGMSPPSQKNTQNNLDHPSYRFLTLSQRKQMLQNHATSYLLELYVRLLTGVNVAEYNLYADPSSLSLSSASPLIIERAVAEIITRASGVRQRSHDTAHLFSTLTSLKRSNIFAVKEPGAKALGRVKITSAFSGPIISSRTIQEKNFEQYFPSKAKEVIASAAVVQIIKKAKTVYNDHLEESKKIFLPKMFDRVFNIVVDPDDFEIDAEETLKSPSGKEAFDKLLRQDVIVGQKKQSTFYGQSGLSDVYKVRERSINESDITFEKYFITIDTVMDEIV